MTTVTMEVTTLDIHTEQSDLASGCPHVCLPIAIQGIGGQLQKIFPGHLDILVLLLFNQGTLIICLLKKCRSLYSEAIQTSSIEALNNRLLYTFKPL